MRPRSWDPHNPRRSDSSLSAEQTRGHVSEGAAPSPAVRDQSRTRHFTAGSCVLRAVVVMGVYLSHSIGQPLLFQPRLLLSSGLVLLLSWLRECVLQRPSLLPRGQSPSPATPSSARLGEGASALVLRVTAATSLGRPRGVPARLGTLPIHTPHSRGCDPAGERRTEW